MDFKHPAFAPYRGLIAALGLVRGLPTLDTLNRVAESRAVHNARGLPLRFFEPDSRLSARAYETRILETGAVPTRGDTWHDVLNALVWLRFPHFKAALNAAHGGAIAEETGPARGRRRDALTVLDESGVWVASATDTLPHLLEARAWRTLFCHQRAAVENSLRFVVVGHALLEKLLAPYPSITGKCLTLITTAADEGLEAEAVAALPRIDTPRALAPLPVQGIPGWDPANTEAAYYENREVFRPLTSAHG